MVENSKIEWTDNTFNPWIGCTKVSPGCDHCYAEAQTKRFGRVEWGAGKDRVRTSENYWRQPRGWNYKAGRDGVRKKVFCASLADVFDNEVPEEWRKDLFELIFDTPHLDWLLLTKRIGNAASMMPPADKPWQNVWLGASIVNQEEADRDIPKLLATPTHRRFLSMEPLLGAVSLNDRFFGRVEFPDDPILRPYISLLDWVIVGGESGAHARPMHLDWARALRDQCVAARVPFLFKQWGEWMPGNAEDMPSELQESYEIEGKWDGASLRVGKKQAGRLLDGRFWDEVPA